MYPTRGKKRARFLFSSILAVMLAQTLYDHQGELTMRYSVLLVLALVLLVVVGVAFFFRRRAI